MCALLLNLVNNHAMKNLTLLHFNGGRLIISIYILPPVIYNNSLPKHNLVIFK
ncbi:hypothetical protein RhiirC2_805657 [Rhizophagus irregularis]|uniref:Uncharacterized protein n=1 Tax=Rhizophagus irregularis TaxID=588596 RepID=A0A2N1KHP8_9GLOM|nr:hypothetical protein RhiirC2_805657 [Rhizophagus irregularis]